MINDDKNISGSLLWYFNNLFLKFNYFNTACFQLIHFPFDNFQKFTVDLLLFFFVSI